MIHVLTACGIPAEFVEAGDGTARREAWRQFVFGAVAPLARSVEVELTEKLETPILLDFSELRASDLAGRSRAYKQLIEAGMTEAQAAIIRVRVMAEDPLHVWGSQIQSLNRLYNSVHSGVNPQTHPLVLHLLTAVHGLLDTVEADVVA